MCPGYKHQYNSKYETYSFDGGSGNVRIAVCQDDQVDELNHAMTHEVIDMAKQDIASIEVAIELLLVSRNLERIADLSTNIAEEVIFQAKARDDRNPALK